MTIKELSTLYNINERSLRRKAAKALQQKEALILNDKKYTVTKSGSSYTFEEIKDKKESLELNKNDKIWLKASEEKKQAALLKAKIVGIYERRDKSLTLSKFLEHINQEYKLKLTQATFFRWVKTVRKAKEQGIPPSYALLDTRGGERGTRKLSKAQEEFLVIQYLNNPDIKYIRLYRYLKNNFENVPSYSTIERFIKRYINSHVLEVAIANNPNKGVSKFRPAFGKMDEKITYANQLWELDATPADIITADGKRYILSAAIDVYSRRVVVVVEESASFTTLSNLFRKAIKKLGIPDAVKTDNGRDYTSNNFSLMCQRLGIDHILVPPYSGYYKPFIERFFKTISHDLFEDLSGYIGHNVAQREALINRQTFEHQLKARDHWRKEYKNGNEFAKNFALKKENKGIPIQIPITRAELEEWIDKWIIMYENKYHSGIKTKPIERFNNSVMPIRRVSDMRVLNVLVGLSKEKKVTKKGITIDKITYSAPELWEFIGERVIVLMDDELGKIYVYDANYNYITTATSSEYMGKSRAEYIKATKAFDKRVRKIVSILNEIRAEQNTLMQQHIEIELSKIQDNKEGIGYEYKTDITKSVIEALEDNQEEVHQELKDDSIVPTEDTKPVFNSPYDRFVYELKHNCVSEKTKKLAAKYPDSWEAAKKAAS